MCIRDSPQSVLLNLHSAIIEIRKLLESDINTSAIRSIRSCWSMKREHRSKSLKLSDSLYVSSRMCRHEAVWSNIITHADRARTQINGLGVVFYKLSIS